jgi:hypothetical protein
VSYAFLRKRLERIGRIRRNEHARVQFRKLEEQLYGVPFYKKNHGARRATR